MSKRADNAASQLRVHYCHGLESGPHGYKAEAMRRWFAHVDAPDMQMSAFGLMAENSFARSALRQVLRTRPTRLAAAAIIDSLDRCVGLQTQALDRATDVLIGSSWGGAVTLVLVAEDIWTGPAVILCPALGLIQRWMRPSGPPPSWPRSFARIACSIAALDEGRRAQLLLVHGTSDSTVPLADSQRLAESAGVRLEEVAGGTHGLGAIVRDESLRDFVVSVAPIQRNRS